MLCVVKGMEMDTAGGSLVGFYERKKGYWGKSFKIMHILRHQFHF